MTLEEAIQAALEYERRVCHLYRRAARDPALAPGREFFGMMADEEEGHVAWLEERLAEWKRDGRVKPRRLDSTVPGAERLAARAESLDLAAAPPGASRSPEAQELAYLEEALVAETETSIFYERVVGELPEEQAELFRPFLEIEHGHRAFVEFQMDMVARLGEWWTDAD